MSKGYISVFMLIAILLLQAVLVIAMLFSKSGASVAKLNGESAKAFYAAESGISFALQKLNDEEEFSNLTLRDAFKKQPDIVTSMENMEIRVYIKGSEDEKEIVAAATAKETSRDIYCTVARNEAGRFELRQINN